ncbi:MAG: branched-chain amino acid ABC transporter permease [Deltaproteobacteria bacterium]|nr:branched-chain amino acid ABC transporter permease [Deltaproteobacteria bacterium]
MEPAAAMKLSLRKTAALFILIVFLILLPWIIRDEYYIHSITVILLFAYLASAWNIVGGFAGQLSLGHAAFVGLGAYTSSLLFLRWGISPWLGMFPGALMAVIGAVLIGYPCFRLRGPDYALSTLAFTWILLDIVLSTERFAGFDIRGAMGVRIQLLGHSPANFQFAHNWYFYYIILVMLFIAIGASSFITRSKLGSYLSAIREDQDVASSVGVNAAKYKMYAGIVSAFLTAFGGTFLAQLQLYVDPFQFFGAGLSIEIALGAIIGGMGTLMGPVVGMILLRSMSEIARTYLGGTYAGAHLVLYGVLLILVMMYLPHGIIKPLEKILARFSSKENGKKELPKAVYHQEKN